MCQTVLRPRGRGREQRALPAYEKPPVLRVDVYYLSITVFARSIVAAATTVAAARFACRLRVANAFGVVSTGHPLPYGVLGSRRPGRVGRCRIPIPDQRNLIGLFVLFDL